VVARLFNKRAALGMVEVPYRSAAQMAQDVAGGTIPVLISSMAAANAMVQAGKIRRLALSSSHRFPPLPELPTLNETVPGVTVDGWFVLVAPAGTPAGIVARMNREIGQFLNGPDIAKRLAGFGLGSSGAGSPQSTGEFISREQAKWRALAVELDIQPQ
jgi:tripartite-type tricarboxylate transporter receptor subunit TctC